MTTDKQREILEAAAKACGAVIDKSFNPSFFNGSVIPYGQLVVINEQGGHSLWNPLINSADTASMCAKLDINHMSMDGYVKCWQWNKPPVRIEHDGTDAGKEAAWRLAASMVAAKLGWYSDE